MKFLQKHFVSAVAMMLLGMMSCAAPQGTRDDYFGYNNKPVVEEEKPVQRQAEPQQKVWRNPMTEEPQTTVLYEPVFVPVTTPWWDRYYGWDDYHYGRVAVIYPHRMRHYRWDYYYANYPVYGYPYYGYPVYYDYPRYRAVTHDAEPVEEKKTVRRVGASRGTVTQDTEKNTRGGDNSGWNVRSRGSSTTNSGSATSAQTTDHNSTSSRRKSSTTVSNPERSSQTTTSTRSRGSSVSREETSTTQSSSSKKSVPDNSSSRSESATSGSTSGSTTTKSRGR
ncbi:MAG TPA: hypothetical protein VEC36_01970 [Patescibacteria group bacterium]|nr:hypothetical protein [Patescibacteria group bacterium]